MRNFILAFTVLFVACGTESEVTFDNSDDTECQGDTMNDICPNNTQDEFPEAFGDLNESLYLCDTETEGSEESYFGWNPQCHCCEGTCQWMQQTGDPDDQ